MRDARGVQVHRVDGDDHWTEYHPAGDSWSFDYLERLNVWGAKRNFGTDPLQIATYLVGTYNAVEIGEPEPASKDDE